MLPYRVGAPLLHRALGMPVVQRLFFPEEVALVRRWMAAVDPSLDPAPAVHRSLVANTWPSWRARALRDPEVFGRWVTIRGRDVLDRTAGEGRGAVVAFPHTELKKLLLHGVFGEREVAIVGNVGPETMARAGAARLARPMADGSIEEGAPIRSAQVYLADRVLRRGGVALLLADGQEGAGGVTVPIFGRPRTFRPGAAWLAVRTGSALVPAFATVSPAGHVTIDFTEPLESGTGSGDERIDRLVRRYARRVEDRWADDLASLEWPFLRFFLNSVAEPSDEPIQG